MSKQKGSLSRRDNPFQPGEPITDDICDTMGGWPNNLHFKIDKHRPVTGQAAINLGVACGNDPNPLRPFYSLESLQRVELQANSNYNSLQVSLRRTSGPLTLAPLTFGSNNWSAGTAQGSPTRSAYDPVPRQLWQEQPHHTAPDAVRPGGLQNIQADRESGRTVLYGSVQHFQPYPVLFTEQRRGSTRHKLLHAREWRSQSASDSDWL